MTEGIAVNGWNIPVYKTRTIKLGSMVLNILLISLLVVTTYLLRSGRVHRASVVFVSLQWLIVMGAVFAFGG
jgi:hypothetical protein